MMWFRRVARWLGEVVWLGLLLSVVVSVIQLWPALEGYRQSLTLGLVVVAPGVLWSVMRRQQQRDNVNGNLMSLIQALQAVRAIRRDQLVWSALPRRTREHLDLVETNLGNVTAKFQGFRDLSEMREALLSEMRDLEVGQKR